MHLFLEAHYKIKYCTGIYCTAMDSYINVHKEQLLSRSGILDSIQIRVLSCQSPKTLNHLRLRKLICNHEKNTKKSTHAHSLLIINIYTFFYTSSRTNKN